MKTGCREGQRISLNCGYKHIIESRNEGAEGFHT